MNRWKPEEPPRPAAAAARYGAHPDKPPADMKPPTLHSNAVRRHISTTIGHNFTLQTAAGGARRNRTIAITSELHATLGELGWRAALGVANDPMHTISAVTKNMFDLALTGGRVTEAMKTYEKESNGCASCSLTPLQKSLQLLYRNSGHLPLHRQSVACPSTSGCLHVLNLKRQ